MGIAKRNPTAVVPEVEPAKAFPDNYESIIYDDNRIPLHALLAHAEGAPWTVDYYRQVVNKHNDLREADPGQSSIYQQFEKILNMEIRVSSALTASHNSETSVTSVNGSGLIYPFIVPNVTDYFISNTADNKTALFKITQVDRRAFNTDSLHSVEYTMVGYIDENAALDIYTTIEEKSIRTYHFSKDRLLEGLDPILKTEDYHVVSNLKVVFNDLVEHYYSTFFNRNFRNLLIPGQSYSIYDHFVTEYIKRIVDTSMHPLIREVKQVPVPPDNIFSQKTLWDHLLFKDYNALKLYVQKTGVVAKGVFLKNPFILALAHSNVDYVVYPSDVDESHLIASQDMVATASMDTIEPTSAYKGNVDTSNNVYTVADKTYQIIHPVLLDEYYVLSQNFYDNTDQQSALEILTKDYLQGKTLDLKMLQAVYNNYRQWRRLEQFYYAPILMTLVKEANRAQYGR